MSSFHGLSRQVAVFQISQQTDEEVITTLQLNSVGCCALLPVPAGMEELTVPGATVSQHTHHFVQHKTSSAGIIQSPWVPRSCFWPGQTPNPVGSKGSSFAQSKRQSPLMQTRGCPSAAILPPLPWPQVLMMHWTCVNNACSHKNAYDIRHVHSWSCDPALTFQRIFLFLEV